MKFILILFTSLFLSNHVIAKQDAGFLNSYYVTSKNRIHLVNENTLKQLDCLAKNIYWEAEGESIEGKIAVAQVTMNRLHSGKHGNTICEVVYQRTKQNKFIVCQFSWTCTRKSKMYPRNRKIFDESREIAINVMMENFRLTSVRSAMYFHSTSINPGWNKVKVAKIGKHVFYRD
jgi:spore germination cell wall hydrolase CwlJ-like protein